MQREVMFAVWRIVQLGGRVPCAPLGLLMRELAAAATRLHADEQPAVSLLDRTPGQWRTELVTTWVRRTDRFPNAWTLRTYAAPLDRICKLLWFAYDESPWWRREIWDPVLDDRIPLRDHEPFGTQAIHWHRIEPAWLRVAALWQVKSLLETGQLAWSTAHGRYHGLMLFGRFVSERGLVSPLLSDDRGQVRPIMLDFLDRVMREPTTRGRRRTWSSLCQITAAVRSLYAFMHDHPDEAVRHTGDPRWARLTPEYLRFWRPGDLPRKTRRRYDERHLFSERVLSQIAQHAHLLGEPRSAGGRDDPQAMRLLLLLIATGRRVSELLMLDPNPIIPVTASTKDGGRVAKLRYQQTKIEGAPDTIFVDQEVVEIIAEQQRWLAEYLKANGCQEPPRYLFIKKQNNARGQDHYTTGRLRQQLQKLVDLAGLTDEDGTPLRLSMTRRFRHTIATSLLNAGVPLHVVQRYIGHTSPEMTMHYANPRMPPPRRSSCAIRRSPAAARARPCPARISTT